MNPPNNLDRAALVIAMLLVALLAWAALRNEPREVVLTIRFQLPEKGKPAHVIEVPKEVL